MIYLIIFASCWAYFVVAGVVYLRVEGKVPDSDRGAFAAAWVLSVPTSVAIDQTLRLICWSDTLFRKSRVPKATVVKTDNSDKIAHL